MIFFSIIVATGHSQTLLREIPLGDQIENSEIVLEGKVIAKKSFWDVNRHNIYTINTIEVLKVFKGESVARVEVVTIGGTVGTEALIVSPSLKLQHGDIGVFTLEKNRTTLDATSKSNNKKYKPYASLQSFYKYSLYDGSVVNSFSKKKKSKASFYDEIMRYTKSDYIQVSELVKPNNTRKGLLIPTDITFDLTSASAGTKTVLTISGTDFGGTQGRVGFSSADEGGKGFFVFALDSQVTEWGDTQIKVEIPSGAGTGPILVQDSTPENGVSVADLIITYAESNAVFDPDDATNQDPPGVNGPLGPYAYPTRHVDDNGSGGYTWEMQTDFFNDANSKDGFTTSLDKWRCETKVNWTISATPTTVDVAASDGVNVVRYDNEGVDDLAAGVLGVCYNRISGCGILGDENSWNAHVFELDIVFDSGTNWYFGQGLPGLSEFDFESVALHELGHGHQLGHVIDNENTEDNTADVMHFAISNSEQQRVLSEGNKEAAGNVQSRSTSIMECFEGLMINSSICNLSVGEVDENIEVSIFPNPSNGQFFIKNASLLNLETLTVYDAWGRLITTQSLSGNSSLITINLRGVAKGMYFVKMYSNSTSISRKILVN
jgi:hypothetical protein